MALTFPQMPAWLVADKPTWAQQSEQTQSVFNMAYQNAQQNQRQDKQQASEDQRQERGFEQQKNMLQFHQDLLDQKNAAIVTKFSGIADKLKGATSPESAWEIVSQNPQWLADPQTAPGVTSYLKNQAEVAKAEVGSIKGKTAIADATDFTKRMSTIAPEDRAAIGGMSRNPDGTPSAMQWKALSLSEETAKVHQQNVNEQARQDAIARGDVVTTTVTDKGVSQRFAPPAANSKAFVPEPPTEYANGAKLIHVSPNRWQYIAPGKGKAEITTSNLRTIAQDALKRDHKDPVALDIMKKLESEALKQLSKGEEGVSAPATPASSLDSTTKSGLKYNIVPLK